MSMVRASQIPSIQQLKDVAFPSSFSALQTAPKPNDSAPPQAPPFPSNSVRPASPYSRRPTPTRSAPPSRGVVDSLRKSNELLSQEVSKLQNQLKHMKKKCNFHEEETEKWHKTAKEASLFATDQSNKSKVAREAIKSFNAQLKGLTDTLPAEVSENEYFKALQSQVQGFIEANEIGTFESQILMSIQLEDETMEDAETNSIKGSNIITLDASVMGDLSQVDESNNQTSTSDTIECVANQGSKDGVEDANAPTLSETPTYRGTENETVQIMSKRPLTTDLRSMSNKSMGSRSLRRTSSGARSEVSRESIEQFAPGVYVTYIQLRSGTKVFRRVRFSKRRFASTQAEEWWKKNRAEVLQKYIPPQNSGTSAPSTPPPPRPVSASSPTTSEDPINKTNEDESEPPST